MSDSKQTPETLIEFPCDFELKAMGKNNEDFQQLVYDITKKYAPEIDPSCVRLSLSKEDKFVSVKIKFHATCIEQIHGIYGDLHKCPEVLMTL